MEDEYGRINYKLFGDQVGCKWKIKLYFYYS